MRTTKRTVTLESRFPLLGVENDAIVSKGGDITVGFHVELPEIFTLSAANYQTMQLLWSKSIRILPNYTIVHKQDIFVKENYLPKKNPDNSFLSESFERHFNCRPYLSHKCYIYITKTTRERSKYQSLFSTLCRQNIIPREIRDKDSLNGFFEAVEQFESIINDSGIIKLRRLKDRDFLGDDSTEGIIGNYFSVGNPTVAIEDIRFDPGEMRIGDNILCVHTISDVDDLPAIVSEDCRYGKFSTEKSDCRLSFAAHLGLLLPCNHIYNQYIFIDDHYENLKNFEKKSSNLNSLSRYSRANSINKEWIDLYLNEAHSHGLLSVRTHCNVVAWSDDLAELKRIKSEVGSRIAMMGCIPRHNTVDMPVLYWAGIPGNAADFPSEETFYTFLEHAVCFFCGETNYRDSLSPFGIKMVDRVSGVPLHLDISDLPMEQDIIKNRNKFILGPSGSGKSFFTNHMVRQYYEQGTHIVLVDTGNSYQGLCELIRSRTDGQDGIYFTYTEESPISFNPFYTDDGIYDIEKRESLKTFMMTLWKRENEPPTRSEEVAISNAVNLFLGYVKNSGMKVPTFNDFYEYVLNDYRRIIRKKNVREKEFDIDNFLNVLEPYYRGGEYDYLLNSPSRIDLLNKAFIVFELDNIRDHRILLPVVTIIIMETFINKMRRLKGIRKMILIEEAWKAIAKEGMADYIKYLFKTVRKYMGEAVIVTQEVDDILSSPIVKESIIQNADTKILLDQRKYLNKFEQIQSLLGLTDKEKEQILSINLSLEPGRKYKEVWIGLGGLHSAVYATEVSPEEYYTYTTEEREKLEVMKIAESLGNDYEKAIRKIAESKRKKQR